MNTKTRTPRPHPYLITIAADPRDLGAPPLEYLIEANSSREAAAWFARNMIEVREISAREVHAAGLIGTPFLSANGDLGIASGDLEFPQIELPEPLAQEPTRESDTGEVEYD